LSIEHHHHFLTNKLRQHANSIMTSVGTFDAVQDYDPISVGTTPAGGDPFGIFFGDPPHPYRTSAYDRHSRTSFNLPEAYLGQNLFLKDTLEQLVLTDETWYTTVALPIFQTDQVSVAWNKWEFNAHVTGLVPEQGVSRLVSSVPTSRTESFLRRGLALQLEHGFMSTARGRANYFQSIRQIANAVNETNNFGVLSAYLSAHDYKKQWQRQHGYHRASNFSRHLQRECNHWAILQKTKFGMEKLDADIVEDMNRYKGRADMWILPTRLSVYLRLVRSEKTDYYLAGSQGPRNVGDSIEPFATFNRNRVYIARTFDIDERGTIDLLRRQRQIGEYNLMVDRYYDEDYAKYKSVERSVIVYDQDIDNWAKVDLNMAIKYCKLFNAETGAVASPGERLDSNDFDSKFNTRFYEEDLKEDFTMMRNEGDDKGGYVPISYIGQIDQKYFGTKAAINAGQTLINMLTQEYGADETAVHTIVKDGLSVLRQLDTQVYNEASEAFMVAVNSKIVSSVGPAPNDRVYKASGIVRQYNNASAGIPSLTDIDPPVKTKMPVGYGSYAGMVALAKQVNNDKYDTDATKKAAAFVELWGKFTMKVKAVLSSSNEKQDMAFFANAKVTSTWFPEASSEAALFENLVSHRRLPLFMRFAGGAEGDADGNTAGNPSGNTPAIDVTASDAINAFFLNTVKKSASVDNAAFARAFGYTVEKGNLKPVTPASYPVVDGDDKTTAARIALHYPLAHIPLAQGGTLRQQAIRDAFAALLLEIDEKSDQIGELLTAMILRSTDGNEVSSYADTDGNADNWAKVNIEPFVPNAAFKTAVNAASIFKTGSKAALTRLTNSYKTAIRTAEGAIPEALEAMRTQQYDGDTGRETSANYVRTPLVVSPALFESIAKKIIAAPGTAFAVMPADHNNPALRMSLGEIRQTVNRLSNNQTIAHFKAIDTHLIGAELHEVAFFDNHRQSQMAMLGADIADYSYDEVAYDQDITRMSPEALQVGSGTAQLLSRTFAASFSAVAKKADKPLLRIAAQAYLSTPFNRDVLMSLVDNNTVLPMGFILARPHARYWMSLGIKTLAGGGTGYTFMGHSDFLLSDDAKVKVHYGHFTYYSKSIIHEEKNVYVARDIHANGTLGGLGLSPYDEQSYDPRSNSYGPGDSDGQGNDSLFVMAIGYNEGVEKPLANPLDISGRFHQFQQDGFIDQVKFRKLHYSTAGRYNAHWGFRVDNDLMAELDEPMHVSGPPAHNTVCYNGHTYLYDRVTSKHSIPQVNTGHWGPNVYPGVKQVRSGQLMELKEMDYHKTRSF
jgi:hypothetical protein